MIYKTPLADVFSILLMGEGRGLPQLCGWFGWDGGGYALSLSCLSRFQALQA